MSEMTSNRPYLMRAIYEWISDNGLTPHVLVDARYPGVEVPQEFVQDGRIVLNVAMTAVKNLVADNDGLSFDARFSGIPHHICVPANSVLALYARENGQGMAFDPVDPPPDPEPSSPETDKDSPGGKPGRARLKVVK